MTNRINWKFIRLPLEVYQEIREQARKEGVAIWKVVHRAWSYWRSTNREHHVEHSELDKVAWYVYKLSSSVGELRGFPSPTNLDLLDRTCNQIEERLGVNCNRIRLAARQYVKAPSSKNRMVLNDAAKSVILDMIARLVG